MILISITINCLQFDYLWSVPIVEAPHQPLHFPSTNKQLDSTLQLVDDPLKNLLSRRRPVFSTWLRVFKLTHFPSFTDDFSSSRT